MIANARLLTSYRGPGGNETTLAQLNYSFVSLDDAWQACGKGAHGSFHDAEGQSATELLQSKNNHVVPVLRVVIQIQTTT